MFMRTLRPSFRAYCTIKRTQGFTDPQDVYDGAIEYSKTNNTDGANTTDAAPFAHQYQTTEMRKCRYGDKCRRWARGECRLCLISGMESRRGSKPATERPSHRRMIPGRRTATLSPP